MTGLYNGSPWLTDAIEKRLDQLGREEVRLWAKLTGSSTVFIPLTEPAEDDQEAFERDERTCDRCGKFCTPEMNFYTGMLQRRLFDEITLIITLGLCEECADKEKGGEVNKE